MSSTPITPGTDARAEYEEFLAATEHVGFAKDFFPALDALMMDRAATHGQRFLAWLKRRSWGNYRLYAGTQADAARELGIDKRVISILVKYYEGRGYLYREGKMLYPTISPKVTPPPEKVSRSHDFSSFIEHWKVSCSSDFLELEVARSTVERLRKVQRAEYKKWLALQTNGGPTLYVDKEDLKRDGDPPPPQPPVSVVEPLEEEEGTTQSMVPLPEPAASAVIEAELVSDEPAFQEFAKDYPGEVDPDSKPAYEALKPEDKEAIKRTLPDFRSCERWQNPRYIPRASNFLFKRYWEFPPPRARTIQSQRMEKSRQEAQSLVAMVKAMRGAPS